MFAVSDRRAKEGRKPIGDGRLDEPTTSGCLLDSGLSEFETVTGFFIWGGWIGDRSGGGGGGGGGEGLARVSWEREDGTASIFLVFVTIVGSLDELGVWGEASDLDTSTGRGSAAMTMN